jgi:hypothetical protein
MLDVIQLLESGDGGQHGFQIFKFQVSSTNKE